MKRRYVVGFAGMYSPVSGKGNNSGIGEYTFPLTLEEANRKIIQHHKMSNEPEFIRFRLVPLKTKKKSSREGING